MMGYCLRIDVRNVFLDAVKGEFHIKDTGKIPGGFAAIGFSRNRGFMKNGKVQSLFIEKCLRRGWNPQTLGDSLVIIRVGGRKIKIKLEVENGGTNLDQIRMKMA